MDGFVRQRLIRFDEQSNKFKMMELKISVLCAVFASTYLYKSIIKIDRLNYCRFMVVNNNKKQINIKQREGESEVMLENYQ